MNPVAGVVGAVGVALALLILALNASKADREDSGVKLAELWVPALFLLTAAVLQWRLP